MWLAKVEKGWEALADAPEAIRADKEIVVAAVKADPRALEYASEGLRRDRAYVLELVTATKAPFLTEWAAEELQEDAAFLARCRGAVRGGLVWTFYHSYNAFDAMRNRFPAAGASVPGGEAYEKVMEELKRADHGSALERLYSNHQALV